MREHVVAAAQMGPIETSETRTQIVNRLVSLLEDCASQGAELVVFTEAALTPFFPHWFMGQQEEIDSYFEKTPLSEDPSLSPLFTRASELGVSFVIGYAELTPAGHHFNSEDLYDEHGHQILKYRKIHLPGYRNKQPGSPFENLEKRYFEVGNLGFRAADWHDTRIGLAICNDRRWAETYRVLALNGAELVCLGYNTPFYTHHLPNETPLTGFHNRLSMQAGAYQNALWVIGTGKAGVEEGVDQLGESMIVAPSGEVVAEAKTTGDEAVVAKIDLDMSAEYREHMFNFDEHRRPEYYWKITEPVPEGLRQE